jgi:hypothetical protein
MNERIQQFAEQARTSVPAGLDTVEWIAEYNRIFAELIVKECAGLCNEIGEYDEYPESEAEACAEYIVKHFGVEE